MTTQYSFFTPYGYQNNSCGYCKDAETGQRTAKSSGSYGARAKLLSVDHYQKLIDRGWRRSGDYLYKPDVKRQCCPQYTIRLPAAEFQPSRDQRQALHRWNKFVLGDDYAKELAKVKPKSKEEKARSKNEFDLLTTVYEAEYSHLTHPHPKPAHNFTVTLEPATFTEEKYLLYEQYQRQIHHDSPSEITRLGFKRFLCTSPLLNTPPATSTTPSTTTRPYGSYHQTYRLNNTLIALSVLDLLPHAISGVYFIYDPAYSKYSFGKLSAIREAALALEGGYEYYYMGFYIHDCVKMRYKGEFRPQYVLDPEVYVWRALDEGVRKVLGERGYVGIAAEPTEAKQHQQEQTETETEQTSTTTSTDPYPTPTSAASSGLSLLSFGFAGATPLSTLLSAVNLGATPLLLKQGGKQMLVAMENLVSWEEGDYLDPTSVKGVVAELAACLGVEVAGEMGVDFGR